ncbi:MAG: nuclear transport factor 2 family protein [Sphingomicrobium sp.]
MARRRDRQYLLSTHSCHSIRPVTCSIPPPTPEGDMSEPLDELSQKGLLSANRYQRRIVSDGDEEALARFLHPDFIVNGPHNICAGRNQILNISQAALAHENCETQIEKSSIVGNVGVLMGNEVVTPADGSLLAAWFGTKPLRRRFTDVYVFEDGRWLFLARQASVVKEAKRFGD